mmetsp:Transcript_19096/g.26728  ORF Transcript_19096/g.26728 Transcript_19096/m.26728 type:complete len:95 (-) Transcript_19096:222-506(-)
MPPPDELIWESKLSKSIPPNPDLKKLEPNAFPNPPPKKSSSSPSSKKELSPPKEPFPAREFRTPVKSEKKSLNISAGSREEAKPEPKLSLPPLS